jgi:hypothetical protein
MSPPDPGEILAMWAGGLAAGVGLVALWKVARPGFVLLGAGVTFLIGVLAALTGGHLFYWIGAILCLGAVPFRSTKWASVPLSVGSLLWLFASGWTWLANNAWGLGLAVSGAVALGGVTSEMLLGHWYLVDPKLPRWPLRRLAVIGAGGTVADALVVAFADRKFEHFNPTVLWVLSATTLVLLVGVWFSLKGRSYTGVMAATGLSYLATLTSLGAVVLGRAGI